MSYRFAIIRCGQITEQHVQHIVKQLALTADNDIISEKTKAPIAKYGATPYFSTAKLIFQRKPRPAGILEKFTSFRRWYN